MMSTKVKYLVIGFLMAVSGVALATSIAGTQRWMENFWFPGDRAIQFGDYPNASIKYNGTNLVVDVTHGGGTVSFPHGISGALNGSLIGNVTPAGGAFTTVSATNTITSTSPTGVGAHKLSGANTACNTTCSSGGCLFGFDLAAGASQPVLVECNNAAADTCLCLQ